MKKPLTFIEERKGKTLRIQIDTDFDIYEESDLIFDSIEMLLGFAKQRDYESADDYNEKLHGVINRCQEKIYENSEG